MDNKNAICLFCKTDSTTFTSIEHILPESLGNKTLILKDIVCDKCNSYFSKLEDYFINHHFTSSLRLFTVDETKKGKIPKQKLLYGEAFRGKDNKITLTQRIPISVSDKQFSIAFTADKVEFKISYPIDVIDKKK